MPVKCDGLSNKQKAKIMRKAGDARTIGAKEKVKLEQIETKIAYDKELLKTKKTNHSNVIKNFTKELKNGKCTKCKKEKNCSKKCSTLYKDKKNAIDTNKIATNNIKTRIQKQEKEKLELEKKQKEYDKARKLRNCLNKIFVIPPTYPLFFE